uniref:Peptidase A1 domain-containing protein n=1 Tax=Aegilops tauschii subsp. strangulata TaxID=200361 RepID=A0A453HCZ1_AEGTS
MFHGPYLTRVMLGNPPQSFDVLIDTGSSLPWIGCDTARLPTRVFYPSPSTSVLGCSDQRCQSLENARNAQCNTSNNRCAYDLGYGNGDGATASSAVGYYISDLVHLNGPSTPARIVFGPSGLIVRRWILSRARLDTLAGNTGLFQSRGVSRIAK